MGLPSWKKGTERLDLTVLAFEMLLDLSILKPISFSKEKPFKNKMPYTAKGMFLHSTESLITLFLERKQCCHRIVVKPHISSLESLKA